jgi:hypothetical protein
MKWRSPKRPPSGSSGLERVTYTLGLLETHFVRSIMSTPVLSSEEKEEVITSYRELRQVCVDGVSRLHSSRKTCGSVNETLDQSDFQMDDVEMEVKFNQTHDDLLYFTSLSLHILERLYLTNRLTETVYSKYKRLIRFLPNLHHRLGQYLKSV